MADTFFISPADLFAAMANDTAPVVWDVRIPGDVASDPARLPTSRALPFDRAAPLNAITHAGDTPVVVVCQKGRKISQGVASAIRARGGVASVLRGGWVAWAEAGLPMVTARPPDVWVAPFLPTRAQTAAAAAIWRWLDPAACILQVDEGEVAATAEVFCAPLLPQGPEALTSWITPLPAMPMAPADVHDLETPAGRAALGAATRMEVGQ